MEVSDATEALLQKLRIEQRKLQQTIHFPSGVDSYLATTPSDDTLSAANNNQNNVNVPHQQQQAKQEEQNRERRFKRKNEEHLLLEIEALHDRIRNLEGSLEYERERHQQTRELLRVALKPPPEENERIHRSYQRDHSGAFIADGPNIRGDDMASILVGAASPTSRLGDLQELRSNNVNNRRSQTPTNKLNSPSGSAQQESSTMLNINFCRYGNGSINNDGIRLAPFPADGQGLGAGSPNVMPARCERYEVYGNKVSSSRAAQLIYEKAHQMEHSPRASRAVLADYKHNNNNNNQFNNYDNAYDNNYYGEEDESDQQQQQKFQNPYQQQKTRHMTPTPARPTYNNNNNLNTSSSTPLTSPLLSRKNSGGLGSHGSARPFGIGEKRFAPISVFGEQSLHRSMYDEGTPRSQVRPQNIMIRRGTTPVRVTNSNHQQFTSTTPRRTMTPTGQSIMTLRSPAARY